jgi:hypothetical protein
MYVEKLPYITVTSLSYLLPAHTSTFLPLLKLQQYYSIQRNINNREQNNINSNLYYNINLSKIDDELSCEYVNNIRLPSFITKTALDYVLICVVRYESMNLGMISLVYRDIMI